MAKMNELMIAERDGPSSEEEDEEKSYEVGTTFEA